MATKFAYEVIATIQTFNGLIERVVCQTNDEDQALRLALLWQQQDSTLFVRIKR